GREPSEDLERLRQRRNERYHPLNILCPPIGNRCIVQTGQLHVAEEAGNRALQVHVYRARTGSLELSRYLHALFDGPRREATNYATVLFFGERLCLSYRSRHPLVAWVEE